MQPGLMLPRHGWLCAGHGGASLRPYEVSPAFAAAPLGAFVSRPLPPRLNWYCEKPIEPRWLLWNSHTSLLGAVLRKFRGWKVPPELGEGWVLKKKKKKILDLN